MSERQQIAPGPGILISVTDGRAILDQEFIPLREPRKILSEGERTIALMVAQMFEAMARNREIPHVENQEPHVGNQEPSAP